MAGIIAVPMMMPRRNSARDASAAILANCDAGDGADHIGLRAAWRSAGAFRARRPAMARGRSRRERRLGRRLPEPAPDDIAFLQYTSGSTSEPKGVDGQPRQSARQSRDDPPRARQHQAIDLCQLGAALSRHGADPERIAGALCRRDLRADGAERLHAAAARTGCARSTLPAEVACSPNFGFDLCVSRYRADQMDGIDLSSLEDRAERRRAGARRDHRTVHRDVRAARLSIRARCFPAYGMAEATLLISGGRRGAGHVTRTREPPALQAHRGEGAFRRRRCADRRRLRARAHRRADRHRRSPTITAPARRPGRRDLGRMAPNVARAYWRNDEATRERPAMRGSTARTTPWLRTGDLGFLDVTGELFVTGRIKDLIIIRGINHYPQDIEQHGAIARTALCARTAARRSRCRTRTAKRRLSSCRRSSAPRATRSIPKRSRAGSARPSPTSTNSSARHIALIRPGALPKTTSGKIQRALARKLWLEGGFEQIG